MHELIAHPQESDTFFVNVKEVACDGGALGHPRVFLETKENNQVVCPYCSRKFIYKAN